MKLYKHYSFDLWLTLIKSNPNFKQKRAKYFFDNFNFLKKSEKEVLAIFRNVDRLANRINEKTGKNLDVDELYLLIISLMNDYSFSFFGEIDIEKIYQDLEAIFFENRPLLYDSNTKRVLKYLKENTYSSVGILSNTGFIRGSTIRKLLEQLEIGNCFDFQIFSDEAGMSKPNQKLFEFMVLRVKEHHKNREIKVKDIIHIGDNPIADVSGAEKYGLSSLLINSNKKSIETLLI